MKKYIIPAVETQAINTSSAILAGSIRDNIGLQSGGGVNAGDAIPQ